MSWKNKIPKSEKKFFDAYFGKKKVENRCNLLFRGYLILKDKSESFCYAMKNKLSKEPGCAGYSNYFKIKYL